MQPPRIERPLGDRLGIPFDARRAPRRRGPLDPEPAPAPESNDAGDTSFTPEQLEWLAFQQVVRDCMADAGQEYLAWEWWNPAPDTSNRFPPMPADLTPEEYAAWKLALDGDAGTGADYRWQDAGCWGYAVHVTGGTN